MFNKKNIVTFVFATVLLFSLSHTTHAETKITIPITGDNEINSSLPTTVNASSAYIKVGIEAPMFSTGNNLITLRYLGKLNLSSVDTTKTIERAVLKFDRNSETLLDFTNMIPVYVLHSLLSSFNENTVTWNTAPSIDLSRSVIGTIIQEPTTASKKVDIEFDITSMVQDWVTGTVANNGFVIKRENENKKNYGGFASTNASTLNAVRPYVEITYSDPVDISTAGQDVSSRTTPMITVGQDSPVQEVIVPPTSIDESPQSPQPTQSAQSTTTTVSGLTQEQVTTIIGLLQSFDVKQSIIDKVRDSLGGGIHITNTPVVTTQPAQISGANTTPQPSQTSSATSQPSVLGIVTGPFGIGMTSPQVTILQQTLAKDASIYPEANISGFYGTLTIKAVERFQCKYQALCSGSPDTNGYGLAGPQTRSRINEVFQ